MADLTLERIAELRAMHEKVRSSGWADAIKAMAEWSLQLRMSSDALLDAAERGLTAMAWTVNGPDVEKPKGDCVCRIETGRFVVLGWSANGLKKYWSANRDGYTLCVVDESVTHFMVIKEPTDA